ncbi:MAG: dTDP-glucose 4,6-dehydratase [Deltaproteobacteria bacterium]|nr:dTDP-glucose 4,6-dehydratase [Deltaproteobacteria bacterium]
MKLLVTGGAGFIGSNFIRCMHTRHPQYALTNFDALTYAGNLENLSDIPESSSYRFVRGDIRDRQAVNSLLSAGFDAIINFAAESHVDRSIDNAAVFVETNVLGTQVLLDAALRNKVPLYMQVSTDEVYGSLGSEGLFTEGTPLAPNSPYSASKASADLFVRAWHETFGLKTLITRCSNNYGPYQFPEKLIPLFITNALADAHLPLYGDGLNVRDWIYVEDHCSAIDTVLHHGRPGEIYNVGGNAEKTNREITGTILQQLGKPESLIRHVADRPGHDRRYAIDNTKIRQELGWQPAHDFESGMRATIQWYLDNAQWWQRVKSGAYREFHERWYKQR